MKLRIVLMLMVFCGSAPDASAFDISSSRANMLGGAVSLSNPTATDFLAVPGLLRDDKALYLDAGVVRQFELSELDLGFLAAGYRHRKVLLAFGVQQFGSANLYAEQVIRAALGYQFGKFSAATTFSAKRLEFGGGYQPLNAISLGLGFGVQTKSASAHLVVDNLNQPSFTSASPNEPRKAALFAEFAGSRAIRVSASARFEENSQASFGLGQTVTLSDFAKLSWGISSEPLIYGAGFEITKHRITFLYAGSMHPALGFSQSLTLGLKLSSAVKRETVSTK